MRLVEIVYICGALGCPLRVKMQEAQILAIRVCIWALECEGCCLILCFANYGAFEGVDKHIMVARLGLLH